MTAAHRTCRTAPASRVTHAGRSVVVTINDRGPFIRGRVLDLSTARHAGRPTAVALAPGRRRVQ